MTTRAPSVSDVGGWFRSASSGVSLPKRPQWGPGTGGFGLQSTQGELREALTTLLDHRIMILTGAGMSTGAGLPDYRGRDAVPRSPMMYDEFIGSDLSRRRYWARSTAGWDHFRAATPGVAHRALGRVGPRFDLAGIVTQNVDGLHQQCGLSPVIDLHGRLHRVICLTCGDVSDRDALQSRLLDLNPEFAARLTTIRRESAHAPDGDAEVDRTESFRYPQCDICGGILKPDVVFFGENADRALVDQTFTMLADADAILVLGSSLTVQSGLRWVRYANRDHKPVVIAGDGFTRGDPLATHRIHGRLEQLLTAWESMLGE